MAATAHANDDPAGPHSPAFSRPEPARDCPLCPRLVAFREAARAREPSWHNAPVPSFGDPAGRLLVVGLAPGLRGANRTGRPFTGDFAGDLLYGTLIDFGFARGRFAARPDDGLTLVDCLLTNAVRCVPPENKPVGGEIANCRPFLAATMGGLPRLAAIVALGRIAHESILRALVLRQDDFRFAHGARHQVRPGLALFDSYHCSRYNTSTRRLTPEMFRAVFAAVRAELGPPPG
ncbi:uracil-DNA glycosylase [Alsobacter sp. SYSU M60028]|uniref:Type-5 uracil-DNA glycosylase n=1 Tax=Alsobacter ponti TaxID=2962936 RepID=A0ABT1LA55_9HYPH|nr:uracil-DNA glycosylase [Alsobacter ponti]MCP8938380.1 uracil-DNA glycosylase [Alsobacter ponti]